MDKQTIIEYIQQDLGNAEIALEGADCNFKITIISDAFTGQPSVKRQQRILKLFQTPLQTGELHALSIKAFTPSEYAAAMSQGIIQLTL